MTGTIRLSCAGGALSCPSCRSVSGSPSLCRPVGPERGVSGEPSPSVCRVKLHVTSQHYTVEIWGSVLTAVLLECKSCGMWRCVTGRVVLGVSKDRSAFIFRVKQSKRNWTAPSRRLRYYNISTLPELLPRFGNTLESSKVASACVQAPGY
jgi:hypothetical protein